MLNRLTALALLIGLLAPPLAGCVATEIKDTTRTANVRTTIEPSEVQDLEYLESTVSEYSGSHSAQAVLAIIANRYADAGRTDLVVLVDMERQPPTTRTRQLSGTEREQGHVDGKPFEREWNGPTGVVTETVPGDWIVHERVYRSEPAYGVPVTE